jgi:hypothetical protein
MAGYLQQEWCSEETTAKQELWWQRQQGGALEVAGECHAPGPDACSRSGCGAASSKWYHEQSRGLWQATEMRQYLWMALHLKLLASVMHQCRMPAAGVQICAVTTQKSSWGCGRLPLQSLLLLPLLLLLLPLLIPGI